MTNHIDDVIAEASTSLVQDIANAPGTLPTPEVEARFISLERQFRHDNTISPLAPRPGEPVEVSATTGSGVRLARATLYYSTDGSEPDLTSAALPMKIGSVTWDERIGYLSHWQSTIPGQPAGTIVRYRIAGWRTGATAPTAPPDLWAHDGQGFWFRFPGARGITTFAYAVEARRSPLPEWMHDAVIYHIFLDRFHPGTPDGTFHGDPSPRGRHGGTIAGVRAALPYIAELGVTCIWLSPLHPSETYHRYDTTDFFGIDPALGTVEEFCALMDDAHALGIKVLLDFVPSHCSWHHPAFLAAQQDRSAPSFSWFTFDEWPNTYRSFLQMTRYLPSFNTEDPGAREYLVQSALYWMREFGVDGFRLDHAIAPSMDFWVAFQTATQAASPDVVNIGEATDTPDSLRRFRGKLHGILDFELAAALRLTFGRGDWGVGPLDHLISSYERFMAEGPGRVSFLDNHDMDRFLWVAGNDVRSLKLAALCQFSLDAVPVIYYGTEIGMTQESGAGDLGFGGDAEARHDMPWDRSFWNQDLLAFYRALISLRREHPILGRGHRRTLLVNEAANTWAHLRCANLHGDPTTGDILFLFNLSHSTADIELPGAPAFTAARCIFSTGVDPETRTDQDLLTVTLPPRTAAALAL